MSTPIRRYYSLDSLRAVMMMLGLVLHTSMSYVPVYPPGIGWPFRDAQTHPLFNWLEAFIHVFRMPVFFATSGFFAAYLLGSRGPAAFLRHRWSRIGVPLLAGLVVMIPVLYGAMVYAQQFSAVPPRPQDDFSRASLEGASANILAHLWFLYHLLIFCVVATLVEPLVRRISERYRVSFLDTFDRFLDRGLLLVLAALSGVILYQMKSWSLDYYGGLFPPLRILLSYALFFLFGWMLFLRNGALERLKGPAWLHLVLGVVFFLAHRHFVSTGCGTAQFCDETAVREHLGAIGFLSPSIWLLVYGFLGLFLRYLDKPSPRWRYLLDASYWTYIVHLPVVIVLPALLAPIAVPALVKATLVVSVASVLILIAYDWGVRPTFIGKQLNGRRYPRGLPQVQANP